MKEQFWEKDPQAIDMFTLKKHMQKETELKSINIMDITKNDYESLKTSEWAKFLEQRRPEFGEIKEKEAMSKNQTISKMGHVIQKNVDILEHDKKAPLFGSNRPTSMIIPFKTIDFSVNLNSKPSPPKLDGTVNRLAKKKA